jgi:hypothetical protein
MKTIYWNGFSNDDRFFAINDISLIINKYGLIANFLRSSDMSLGLSIEIEENKVNKLYHELEEKMHLTGKWDEIDHLSSKECLILLHLTFTNSTGELEIANPGLSEVF